jgi:aryl-alcohol dehydrogenase-like predicted oxidoreductase
MRDRDESSQLESHFAAHNPSRRLAEGIQCCMEYRALGSSGINVSTIGFGCWTMGGPNWSPQNGQAIGWADVNEDEILAAIKLGLDAGVNHWDNADVYGNGRAERILGRCLKKLGIKPGSQVVATKVGHFRGTAPHAYHPAHIRNQCEQSLRNLQVDAIDLYYFHHGSYVGEDVNGQQHDYLHEAAATMHALVKEGKVRAIGQSAYTNEDFERAIPILKPHALQNKANLRFQDFIKPGCKLQQLMTQYNCTFVAFGPLDQGILLDKFDPSNPPQFGEGEYRTSRKDFAASTLHEVRGKLATVRDRANAGGFGFAGQPTTTPGTAQDIERLSSITQRWLLAHANIASVIPGFRNPRQATCNVAAAKHEPMNEAEVKWLRELFA